MVSYDRRKPRASKARKVGKARKKEPEEKEKPKRKRKPKVPAKPVRKKKKPVARKPVRKKPVARKRKPVARKRKPVRKKPVARKRKPVRKKPVAKKRKPIAKKPVARKPVRKKPVAKKRKPVRRPVKRPPARKPPPTRRPVSPLAKARALLREMVKRERKRRKIKRRRLPRKMRKSHRIAGGEQRLVYVGRVVTPENVEEIMYRVQQVVATMSGVFGLWIASLEVSALGDKIIGYGQHLVNLADLEDEEGRVFQVQAYDSTGVWSDRRGMNDALYEKLEDYASERTTAILVHYIKVMNFDRR